MSPDPHHIIGVDGGGTRCRVAIATASGSVIGTATGPAANVTTDAAQAIACLRDTIAAAQQAAGLTAAQTGAAVAHLGLAGVITDAQAGQVAQAMPMRRCTVTDDRPTTMAGALGDTDGCVAALGTGAFFGCQRGGICRYVGGWGLVLGDEASGAWIGRRVLSRVLAWQDGFVPASPLLQEVLDRFDTAPARIIAHAQTTDPAGFAALAPLVIGAAAAGDAQGRAIMQDCAGHVAAALAVLGFAAGDALCLTGGVGPHVAAYLAPAHQAAVTAARGTALDGALLLARRALHGTGQAA